MKVISSDDGALEKIKWNASWTIYAWATAITQLVLLKILSPFLSYRVENVREAKRDLEAASLAPTVIIRRTEDSRESTGVQALAYNFLAAAVFVPILNTFILLLYKIIVNVPNEWIVSIIMDGYFPWTFACGFVGAYYLHVGARLEQQENKILEESPSERVLFERRDKPTNKFTIFMGSLGFLLGCGLSFILMYG